MFFKVLIFACIVAYAAATTPLLAAPFFAQAGLAGLAAPFAYGRPPHPLTAYSHLSAPLAYRNAEVPTTFTAYNGISTDYRPTALIL